MASKVDLGQQAQFQKDVGLPPRPPASHIGFHNRGGLFSTIRKPHSVKISHKIICSQQTDTCKKYTISDLLTQENVSSFDSVRLQTEKAPCISTCQKRVCSAHGRLEHSATNNCIITDSKDKECIQDSLIHGHDVAVYDVNMNLSVENVCRKAGGSRNSKVCPHKNKSVVRPSSAKSDSSWASSLLFAAEEKTKVEEVCIKPSVYGYSFKRQVYGSSPDIFNADSHMSVHREYRHNVQLSPKNKQNETHHSALKNGPLNIRKVPAHMEPLHPWLTETVDQRVIGVDPTTCLVFLPLNQTFTYLPVVPL